MQKEDKRFSNGIDPFNLTDLSGKSEYSKRSSSDMFDTLRMRQIMSGSEHRFNSSMMEPPSNENPFNSRLYDDRVTMETTLKPHPRLQTKYDNYHKTATTDIALFDTKNIGYHAEELIGPNVIQQDLLAQARSRVLSPESYMLDDYYRDSGYNPRLPISDTNKLPTDKPPLVIDERILHHTGERPYTYLGDRQISAVNLLRSPDRKDRLARQYEADVALQKKRTAPRAYQPQDGYLRQMFPTIYHDMDDKLDGVLRRDMEDPMLPTVQARQHRIEYYPDEKETFVSDTGMDAPKGIIGNIVQFFSKNVDTRDKRGEINMAYSPDLPELPTETGVRHIEEPFVTKPRNAIVRRGADGITHEFPNDYDAASYMAITKDPLQSLPVRTMALLHNNNFMILQQKSQSSLFTGDYRTVGDDVICTSVPVKLLEPSFFRELKRRAVNSTNAVKLTYDEFKDISNFADNHPEMQVRLEPKNIPDHKIRSIITQDYIDEALVESYNVYPGAPTVESTPGSQYRTKFEPDMITKPRAKGIGRKFDD